MAQKYEADAERFKARLDQLGVRHEVYEISTVLDISASHAANMLHGRKRYTAPMQRRLDALIDAKANGVEEVEQAIVTEADDSRSARLRYRRISPEPGQKYQLVNDANGDMCVVHLVATFKDGRKAQDYLNWLNKESE